MDEVIREGLDCAHDFLAGLLEHLGMDGYYDPRAGHVSTRFVLDRIIDAQNVAAQRDGAAHGD